MAKQSVEKALAPVSEGGALSRPDFLPANDNRGTEHLTEADIQMPRLALAQGLTPQVSSGKEGFSVGILFNSLTEQIYGRGPIEFTIVRADPPRYVEFIPRDEGGGVRDPNVEPGDPRTLFTKDADGNPLPPLATKFYDFIVLMLPLNREDPMGSIIALSFKSSGLKVAKQLNGLMKLRAQASFAGKYSLTTASQTNAKGTFAVYQVKNAGWVDQETYGIAEQIFDNLQHRTIVIERDDVPESGDTDFPHGENVADRPQM